jgi:hypothetical protein
VSESYEGRQIVGMGLHRRLSVVVWMTETGERLETVRISKGPVPARTHHRGQAGQVGGPPFRQPMRGRRATSGARMGQRPAWLRPLRGALVWAGHTVLRTHSHQTVGCDASSSYESVFPMMFCIA